MDNSTTLAISYANLKEMLEVMQEDGLSAEGCRYDLFEDAAKYIAEEVASGNIAPIPEDRRGHCYVDSVGYERCSVCNESEHGMRYFRFCPHCGAKMDS